MNPEIAKGAKKAKMSGDLCHLGALGDSIVSLHPLAPIHFSQMVAYLAATQLTLGLLINFHVRVLRDGVRRVLRSERDA